MDKAVNENFPGVPKPVKARLPDRADDAGPWVHVPAAAPLAMPVQDFAAAFRDRQRTAPPRLLGAARSHICGCCSSDGRVWLRAVLHSRVRGHDAAAVPVSCPLDDRFRMDCAWQPERRAWVSAAVCRRTCRFSVPPPDRGTAADSAHRAAVSRLSRRPDAGFRRDRSDGRRTRGAWPPDRLRCLRAVRHARRHRRRARGPRLSGAASPKSQASFRSITAAAPETTARKAGNIAEWIGRFGAAYEHFIILDGDSIMSGATLVSLAQAMERDPQGWT